MGRTRTTLRNSAKRRQVHPMVDRKGGVGVRMGAIACTPRAEDVVYLSLSLCVDEAEADPPEEENSVDIRMPTVPRVRKLVLGKP